MTDEHSDLVSVRNPEQKLKHNYTSELELKSLLIRIKNRRALSVLDAVDKNQESTSVDYNNLINKYIKWHTAINSKKYEGVSKRGAVKRKLKDKIVSLSEVTLVDNNSYERFGEIILLMVKNILKKPQFSGYTYKDDFYSDAVFKILKYLDNFDHNLISERTGLNVNAFAYISQIIHNSILFIINSKKKESELHKKQVQMETISQNIQVTYNDWYAEPSKFVNPVEERIDRVQLTVINGSLCEELISIQDRIGACDRLELAYPASYLITLDEYNEMKDLLHGKVSIIRAKPAEQAQNE